MAIHVFKDAAGDYTVWTDCEPGHHHSGRCIGQGETFDVAVTDAQVALRDDIEELNYKSPADVIEE